VKGVNAISSHPLQYEMKPHQVNQQLSQQMSQQMILPLTPTPQFVLRLTEPTQPSLLQFGGLPSNPFQLLGGSQNPSSSIILRLEPSTSSVPGILGDTKANPINLLGSSASQSQVNSSLATQVSQQPSSVVVPVQPIYVLTTDTLLSVVLSVGNSWIPFLIDTGCLSSVLSTATAERLRAHANVRERATCPVTFKMADGNMRVSKGLMTIFFEQFNQDQDFYVVDITIGAILGLDFMVSVEANLDFASNSFVAKGVRIPLIPGSNETRAICHMQIAEMEELDIVGDSVPIQYPMEEKEDGDDQWREAAIGTTDMEMRSQLEKLLKEHSSMFRSKLPPNHECRLPPYKIVLNDNTPIRTRPYRYSIEQAKQARLQVDELVKARAIEKSQSAWSSPVVLVSKKDSTLRMCVDYRRLNKVTVEDAAWIPRMENHLALLGNSSVYSTLDMTSGYHQVRMEASCRMYTAFSIDNSGESYQWRRLPFGLRNAPIHFMRSVSAILKYPFVLAYIDDIIIHSANPEIHLEHLTTVLKTLRQKKIILKPAKCVFMAATVNYLGHAISASGIRPLQDKFLHVKSPEDRAEAKSLLGLLSFYRKFIHQFAHRTTQIQKLIRIRESFSWNEDCERELRDVLRDIREITLSHPNFKWVFAVCTDAANKAIGAVINQINPQTQSFQPLGFYSRSLTAAEQKYPIAELEALALVFVTERCPELLAGRKFLVFCDNRNLVQVLNSPKNGHSNRLTRYGIRLSEFNFDVHHVSTKFNVVADYLSRYHEEKSCQTEVLSMITRAQQKRMENLEQPQQQLQQQQHQQQQPEQQQQQPEQQQQQPEQQQQEQQLQQPEQQSDNKSNRVTRELFYPKNDIRYHQTQDPKLNRYRKHPRFVVEDGVLYFLKDIKGDNVLERLVVIPASLVTWILTLYHNDKLSGHRGFRATIDLLGKNVWFRSMRNKTLKYIRTCHICQMNKSGPRLIPVLQPLVNTRPMQRVQIDLVGPLPISDEKYQYILVVRDAFTRFVILKPLRTKEAKEVVLQFLQVIGIFGVPGTILSDNGKEFKNQFSLELSKALGIRRQFSTPYRPQTNGAVERCNRSIHSILTSYLRSGKDEKHNNWPRLLPFVEYSLNTSINRSTGFCAFQLMFGHAPNMPGFLNEDEPTTEREHVQSITHQFWKIWQLANQNRIEANDQMVLQQPKINPHSYTQGQLVKIFSWKRAGPEQSAKWLAKWLGPFQIVKVLSGTNIQITDGKKKQIIHVTRTLPYHQKENEQEMTWPELPEFADLTVTVDGSQEDFEVDRIVSHRTIDNKTQYLIKWSGFSDADNTWEPEGNLSKVSIREYWEHNS